MRSTTWILNSMEESSRLRKRGKAEIDRCPGLDLGLDPGLGLDPDPSPGQDPDPKVARKEPDPEVVRDLKKLHPKMLG